ncbi:MAG: hypothetical protein G01um10143_850 [Parcubacteria group bacterium Gr01-1014_3]|nr:MAG: hypothetical protein G01um10143_850 [Parcubacteria group bacterium Gr01-1014_3]
MFVVIIVGFLLIGTVIWDADTISNLNQTLSTSHANSKQLCNCRQQFLRLAPLVEQEMSGEIREESRNALDVIASKLDVGATWNDMGVIQRDRGTLRAASELFNEAEAALRKIAMSLSREKTK